MVSATRAPRRARGVCFTIIALVLVALVVYGGTLTQSRWSGSLAPCTRTTDLDGSTWQTGTSTMRWIPPVVHCHYARTGYAESAIVLPEADSDHIARLGMAFVAALLLAVSAPVVAISLGIRRARRRDAQFGAELDCAQSGQSAGPMPSA